MIQFIFTKMAQRAFNKTLKEYVRLNKRNTAGLVEHTAKKVVTGFSPRSPSALKVKGLRQFYYEKRATATKIKQEAKDRSRQGKGTLRPPKKAVSKKAKGLKRNWKAAINWRSKRGTAWLQSTMLYPQWRPKSKPRSMNYKPSQKKHQGSPAPTKTLIRTTGSKPFVLWKSKVPGVLKNKHRKQAVRGALRGARRDMLVYIRRKHQQMRMGE